MIQTGAVWHNRPPQTREAAKELLSLPLEDKLTYTCANISEWEAFTAGNWYISLFNGDYVSQNGRSGFNIEAYKYLLDAPFLISHMCCEKTKKRQQNSMKN